MSRYCHLMANGGGEREVWIVGVPTVTLWSSGVHIWSNIPHNKCIDAFEHSQYYMRLVCACKATLFPLNMWGKEENMHAHPYVKVSPKCGVFSPKSSIWWHPNSRDRVTFEAGLFDTTLDFLRKVTMVSHMFYSFLRVKLHQLHRQICGKEPFSAALAALPGDHMCVMQHWTAMLPAMDEPQSRAEQNHPHVHSPVFPIF